MAQAVQGRHGGRGRLGLALVLLLAAWGALPVRAAEPTVSEVRISRVQGLTRISISLSDAVQFRAYVLGAPYRVIVDLPPVDWQLGTKARIDNPPVTAWRFGGVGRDIRRIVFDLSRPVRIQKTFALPPRDKAQDWRLVIDLEGISRDEFQRLLREQRGKLPDYTAPGQQAGQFAQARRNAPLVVIDPGHGGIDPGTTGKGGTEEKDIVLLVARALRKELWATGRFRVLLTRSADYYISLRQRFEIARSAGADLFVSLHVDSSPFRNMRGLSVYTLSNEASDAEAAALARRENRSDAVAGVDISHKSDRVAGILIDLAQRRSMHDANILAGLLVAAMRGHVELVPRPHRAAGFVVLKAPDVPSVLIELGHLSNPKDEHLLRSAGFRRLLAQRILAGVERYFAALAGSRRKAAPHRPGGEADAAKP